VEQLVSHDYSIHRGLYPDLDPLALNGEDKDLDDAVENDGFPGLAA